MDHVARPTTPTGVAGLRQAYERDETSPQAVVDDLLERLSRQAQPQAWIHTLPEADLRARAAALARVPRGSRTPLFGVPFAVKDNIDVAGLPTTVGCPDFAYRPTTTATAVRRLLDAGAMLVGKTNLDQFATGLTGARSPYGSCHSVLDPELVSGGSSSGSAVVVAAGLVPFSLGTDTAGSGRVPAALNGLVGLKPTRGLVSTHGVFPACRSLDCVSVFARDVPDAWDVVGVMAGTDHGDPWSRPARMVPAAAPSELRVGVMGASETTAIEEAGQRRAYETAVDRLRTIVAEVVPLDIAPFLEAGELLYGGPWVAERYAVLGDFLERSPGSVHPVTAQVLRRGRDVAGAAVFRGIHALRGLEAHVERVWSGVDAIVLPTVGSTVTLADVDADPIGTNTVLGRYTQFANLLDLAVVAVPGGSTDEGRPTGLSVVGPAFSDATLARLGHALGQAMAVSGPVRPWVPAAPAAAVTTVGHLQLAVVGHHLSGGPRNHELLDRGARLVETTTTADAYRLYCLGSGSDVVPGLVRTPDSGSAIEVEVWSLPAESLGSLLAGIGGPLGLGTVELADGRHVIGFLCEGYAVQGALDISGSGGWRAFRDAGLHTGMT